MNGKSYAVINGLFSERETGLEAMAERCWNMFNGSVLEFTDVNLTKNLVSAFRSRNLIQKLYVFSAPSAT
jgi:hypothetical protein